MLTYPCPKGHASIEPDYCSKCGTKISDQPRIAAIDSTPSAPTLCPDCTAPHDRADGNFCEICGYNFATQAHGQLPIVPVSSPPEASDPPADVPVTGWEVVITIDLVPHDAASPPPPADVPPLTLVLTQPTNLIGRTSEKRAVYPEIAIDFDDAVSHRHALLTLQPDGGLILRDIGSSNGTQLNGIEIAALVDIPIKDGDAVAIGHWTRLTLHHPTP